jgi:hypothetical protein
MFKFLSKEKYKNKKKVKNKKSYLKSSNSLNKNSSNINSRFDQVFAPARPNLEKTDNPKNPKKSLFYTFASSFKSILKNKNKVIIYSLCFILFSSLGYLLCIDKYFLVKNLEVTFPNGSYLSKTDLKKFKKDFEESYASLIAKNNIWFVSSPVLTSIAKDINPTIETVTIVDRQLPNKLKVNIQTAPILATIVINNSQSWRVNQNGQFVTQDDIGLEENAVHINTPVTWNSANYNLSQFNLNNVEGQMEKLYFVNFIRQLVNEQGYNLARTEIESLEDNSVSFMIDNQTWLKFDPSKSSIINNSNKTINILNNKKINQQILDNQLSYIDFRIPENVFICQKNKTC